MPIDAERLRALSESLSDVVAEPGLWPEFLEQFAKACGGHGALLLPSTGSEGVAASPGTGQAALEAYVHEGWYEGDRDPRKRAIPIYMRGEIAVDADVITVDEIRRDPMYNELLPRFESKWWAGVGFLGAEGQHWCLSLHRSASQGAFEDADKRVLEALKARLTEISKLSYIIGRAAFSEVANSFDRIQQAVIVIDDRGRVIRANASADRVLDDAIKVSKGQLVIRDGNSASRTKSS